MARHIGQHGRIEGSEVIGHNNQHRGLKLVMTVRHSGQHGRLDCNEEDPAYRSVRPVGRERG